MARRKRPHQRSRQSPSAAAPAQPATAGLLDGSSLLRAAHAPLWMRIALPLVVAVCAFVAFLPALNAEFLDWDDDAVILSNANIRGLTSDNINWMFTKTKMGHYHPLTWLSYAIDHAIGQARYESLDARTRDRYEKGLDPRIVHLTNMLLHVGVAVGFYFLALMLLRLMLPKSDGSDRAAPLAAAVAALLFACHPLRVESVAWATERRDVLSSFFLIPCLVCYLYYAIARQWGLRKLVLYAASFVLLALSLLSKAWGITLPAVMLLLDIHPLRRIGGKAGWLTPRAITAYLDKVPFAILSLWFAIQAKHAQQDQLDTYKSWAEWTAPDRISQAFYGLFYYVYKTLIPVQLTPIVELPVNNNPFAARYVIAAFVVIAAAAFFLLMRKRWPGGLVAAVCYAGVVSPVLGFAQSGPQLVADRYSYLSCMPFAIMGGAGLLWLARQRSRTAWSAKALPAATGAAVAICALFAVLTWRQTTIWQTSYSLWSHAYTIDPDCVLANTNLGMLDRQAGRVQKAIDHYKRGLNVNPESYVLLSNLAIAVQNDESRPKQERLEDALSYSREAVRLQPKYPDLRIALASLLQDLGRFDEAIEQGHIAIKQKPQFVRAHRSLAESYRLKGKATGEMKAMQAAEQHYRRALDLERALNPRGDRVIFTLDRLAWIAEFLGRPDDAIGYFQQLLDIDPENRPALRGIARLKSLPPP